MIQRHFGSIFKTNQLKQLTNILYDNIGIKVASSEPMKGHLRKQYVKMFNIFDYSNKDVKKKENGISYKLHFKIYIKSGNTEQEEITRFDFYRENCKFYQLRIKMKRETNGKKTSLFKVAQVNDNKNTVGNVEMEQEVEIGGTGNGEMSIDSNQSIAYCKFVLSIIPLSNIRDSTQMGANYDTDNPDTIFQGEMILYPDLFCTTKYNYPNAGYSFPTNNANFDQYKFRAHGPIADHPARLSGPTNSLDRLWVDEIRETNNGDMAIWVQHSEYFSGGTFGYQMLFNPNDDILQIYRVEVNGVNSQVETTTYASWRNDRIKLNFHPNLKNKANGCQFWGGPLYYDSEDRECLEVKEDMRDSNCVIYRSSGSCYYCNRNSYIDYFRRGRCRPTNQGCPHNKGAFRVPILWKKRYYKFCFTCPQNSWQCYGKDKWIYFDLSSNSTAGCIPGLSEITNKKEVTNYSDCKCKEDNCLMCEMTKCDFCQWTFHRVRSLSGEFSCSSGSACENDWTKFYNQTSTAKENRFFCMDLSNEHYSGSYHNFGRSVFGFQLEGQSSND